MVIIGLKSCEPIVFKSIRIKLFIIFLTTTLVVVAGMYSFMQWSLEQGFSSLMESRQQQRVVGIVDKVTEYYVENKGWDKLIAEKKQWVKLLWQSKHSYRQLPHWLKRSFILNQSNVWPPDLPEKIQLRRFMPMEFRVMLLDVNKSVIFGRAEQVDKLSLTPILYQQQTVGFLGVLPGKLATQLGELQFIEKQAQSFIGIAIIMVVLSAILALLLAYALGRRLRRIAAATKKLAVGQYDIRLPVTSVDEVGQLAQDFNEMAAALGQAENTRQRWVADISHEIRTPLAVLRGELEALQDGIRPLNRAAIDSLYADVMRLNRLTEDLYHLSLSDQGALSYRKTRVDPVQILQADLETFASEFKRKQFSVNLEDDLVEAITIYADPDRLSQLYRNLITNSVKYTDQGGQLNISFRRDDALFVIEFSDSAPGVPEQELPKLFDRFYRLENSRNRNYGGAGLGLAICNNIVAAHNGSIQAQQSVFKGLKIKIELPIGL